MEDEPVIPLLLLFALGGLMHAARSFSTRRASRHRARVRLSCCSSAYFTGEDRQPRSACRSSPVTSLAGVIVRSVRPRARHHRHGRVAARSSATPRRRILALEAGAELQPREDPPDDARRCVASTVFAVVGTMVAIAGVAATSIAPTAARLLRRPRLSIQAIAVCVLDRRRARGAVARSRDGAALARPAPKVRSTRRSSRSVVVADLGVIVCSRSRARSTGAVIGGGIDVAATASTSAGSCSARWCSASRSAC